MLRDLEELLHQVRAPEKREHMNEALRCYAAGAYRAAVVIAVAAGLDDLRQKLGDLASSGGAPQPVKDAHNQIEQQAGAGQAFESQLISYCRHTVDMLTQSESDKLGAILKIRHLCAHPSGHGGTAEEARDAIATMIDLVLSRPAAMGIAGVTNLLDRLAGPNFFPNQTSDSIARTVHSEMTGLHHSVRVALGKRLVDTIRAEAATPNTSGIFPVKTQRHLNSVAFLRGMVGAGGQLRDCAFRYFGDVVEDPITGADALDVLVAEPVSIQTLPVLTRERCVSLARRHLRTQGVRGLIRAWGVAGLLTNDDRREINAVALATLSPSNSPDVTALAEIGSQDLLALALDQWIDSAGTHQFTRANAAINALQSLTPEYSAAFTNDRRAAYLLHVVRHSQGTYANNAAAELLVNGLGPRVDCIDPLLTKLAAVADTMAGTYTDWDALIKLLTVSGRGNVKQFLVTFLSQNAAQIPMVGAVLATLSSDPDPAVATAAMQARTSLAIQ